MPALMGHLLDMAGRTQIAAGNADEARHLSREALTIPRDAGALVCTAHAIEGVARYALNGGDAEVAARLVGASDGVLERLQMVMMPIEQALKNQTIEATRERLGEDAFPRAREEGRAMSQDQAIAFAPEVVD